VGVRILATTVGTLMSSEPRGFGISGRVLAVEGLGGLSTFGGSLSGEIFFVGKVEGIS
jgi:hypothetical protein